MNNNIIEENRRFKEECNTIKTMCSAATRYMSLRKDFSEETRLLLLVDKLQLFSLGISSLFESKLKIPKGITDPEIVSELENLKNETCNDIRKSSDQFINELQALCLNIHRISNTLTSIETKLNSVLEGPNYELGHQIMVQCEKDFNNLSEQLHK